MRQKLVWLLALCFIAIELGAQATGNVIYNSNNRFQQNDNYRRSSSGALYQSAAPYVGSYTSENNVFSQLAVTGMVTGGYQISSYDPNYQEVIMNIRVLYNAKPTGYMAIFHINQAGKKISDLDTMVSKRINKFMQLAKGIGIGSENFYTDMIALVPIFREDKRNNTKPKGFEIQKNVHVKYNNPSQLDHLFSMAAQCEIYDLIKVEYLYSESEKAGVEMHNKAMQVLNGKIDFYKKIGITLDTAFRMINENGKVFFQIVRYTSYQPLSINSLEDEDKPGDEQEVMKTKAGMINRTTVFYNPTNLTGFDAVINADPLEPPIQFIYSLQVRYRIHPTQKIIDNSKVVKEHELLIITPQGEIKTIQK